MRFRKVDRYLLLLAGCFVVALLRTQDLPGEAVLPEAHRALVHAPLLLPLARQLEDPSVEVERLRTELDAARHEIDNLRRDFDERQELRAYFRDVLWPRPPVAIPAWVVAIERNPYRRMLTIDAGSDRGVEPGMAVVCGRALLGRVLSVTRERAVVQRVDDPEFRLDVAVRIGERDVPGIVSGDNAGGLELEFVGPGEPLPLLQLDTNAVDRAIANLLDNAIKYSKNGGRIEVRLVRSGSEVILSVSDRGIGIPADEHDRVFDRFHRVSTGLVHDVKGTGLGLSLVQHIVHAHGGRVRLESELGKGSTFFIHLPVDRQSNENERGHNG